MDGHPDRSRKLRAWLASANLPMQSRLPPERDLAKELGMGRSALRAGLAVLEAEGAIWRHVGRGTFTGSRPATDERSLASLASRTHPEEVMEARLMIEPGIAGLAAKRATRDEIGELGRCLHKAETAHDFQSFELWDSAFHRVLAQSAHNALLIGLFNVINAIRDEEIWGRMKIASLTRRRQRNYDVQHRAVLTAIEDRDPAAAAAAMRAHIETVRQNLLNPARDKAHERANGDGAPQ